MTNGYLKKIKMIMNSYNQVPNPALNIYIKHNIIKKYINSRGPSEPVYLHSITRAFTVCTYAVQN